MSPDNPTSKAFHHDKPIPKDEHERKIGEFFRKSYSQQTGIQLSGNTKPDKDPPDRIFTWKGLTIGVELLELEQFYSSRAFINMLTNLIYKEIDNRGLTDRYPGITISFPSTHGRLLDQRVREEWEILGIRRNQFRAFAREFADAISEATPSRDSIPSGVFGKLLQIDSKRFPALSRFGDSLKISKSPVEDPKRSNGKASPLVILTSGITYTDGEMISLISEQTRAKMKARGRWEKVDHAILLVHDFPRTQYYEGFGRPWVDWLHDVASSIDIANSFDELWLATFQRCAHEVIRIYGSIPTSND